MLHRLVHSENKHVALIRVSASVPPCENQGSKSTGTIVKKQILVSSCQAVYGKAGVSTLVLCLGGLAG